MITVDIFTNIVSKVSNEIGTDIDFNYGTITEIQQYISQLTNAGYSDKKYPAIWLMMPFVESNGTIGLTELNLKFYIVTLTDKSYFAKDRYENVYKPVLIPIFDEFITQIVKSGYFNTSTTEDLSFDRSDRIDVGREIAIGATDSVDCIELSNFILQKKKKTC